MLKPTVEVTFFSSLSLSLSLCKVFLHITLECWLCNATVIDVRLRFRAAMSQPKARCGSGDAKSLAICNCDVWCNNHCSSKSKQPCLPKISGKRVPIDENHRQESTSCRRQGRGVYVVNSWRSGWEDQWVPKRGAVEMPFM